MHRRMTITLDEAVYEGLYRTIGKRRMSQFIEDLVRPHVMDTTLDDVSNDAANRNLARVVVVPLTSNTGRQYPGEALVTVVGKQGKAMADQIMAAEKGRVKSRLDVLSKADMLAIEDAILIHLGMPK